MCTRNALLEEKSGNTQIFDSDGEVVSRSFHESDYHDSRAKKSRSRISKLRLYCLCCTCSVLVAVLALTVTILARVRPITSSLTIASSLVDTQILHIKDFYCKEVTIAVIADVHTLRVNMYLLNEVPGFTKFDYEIDDQLVIGSVSEVHSEIAWFDSALKYVTWKLHLNPGSNVGMIGCVSSGSGEASYLVIQGEVAYNYWKFDPSGYDQTSFLLSHELHYCTSSFDFAIPFSSEESDQYFFVFVATKGQPMLDLKFQVSSMEYSLQAYSGLPNCTANTTDSCSLKTPPLKYHHVLFEIPMPISNANQSVPYGQPVELDWTCDPREWAYLMLFGLLFVIGECIMCVSCCCCLCCSLCCCSGKNAEQQPLVTPPTSHAVVKIGPSTTPYQRSYYHTLGPAHSVKSRSSSAVYSPP